MYVHIVSLTEPCLHQIRVVYKGHYAGSTECSARGGVYIPGIHQTHPS